MAIKLAKCGANVTILARNMVRLGEISHTEKWEPNSGSGLGERVGHVAALVRRKVFTGMA